MIRVHTSDPDFREAYQRATQALPVERFETPRQYGRRWLETYRCRVDPSSSTLNSTCYVFDRDEDYTWFILKWS